MKKETTIVADSIHRVVFMGSPQFAVQALQKLHVSGFEIVMVVTQPDAPKGRGLTLQPNPVTQLSMSLGLPILQPQNVNEPSVFQEIADLQPDIIITAAYGGYIGKQLRTLAPYGCINLHPSLLPQYRGSSPVSTCLRDGNALTGNTVYRMTAKIDAGPILTVAPYPILAEHNFNSLEHDLAHAGADLLITTLQMLSRSEISEQKQDETKATYTSKLNSALLLIDWNQSALRIHNHIRSLADEPGTVTHFREKTLKVLASQLTDIKTDAKPGTILDTPKNKGILVAAADYALLLTLVHPQGKKQMSAYAFHMGARIEKGEMLG